MTLAARTARLFQRLRQSPLAHYMTPAVAIVVTVAAFWLLHKMTAELRLADMRAAILSLPGKALGLSLLATLVSYAALASYDVQATRIAAPGKVNWLTAVAAGTAGFAFSNFLGFHLLTGGAVRYRIYARLGLDASAIARIIILTWTGLWLAITVLIALAVMIDPVSIPFIHVLHPALGHLAGAATLLGIVGLFFAVGRDGRDFDMLGWKIAVPGRGPLMFQLVAGLIDVAASTFSLYILMPPDLQPAFPAFVVVYLCAVLLGAVSHVPGGMGVFEVAMMAALGAQGRADAVAALVAYRTIYYAVPFVIALAVLSVTEASLLQKMAKRRFGTLSRILKPLVPPVAAVVVFMAGIVLLFSGAIPRAPARLAFLEDWLPLSIVESSHFLGSLAGMALLVIASGLRRRLHAAWVIAMLTLLAGVALSLLKGLDWEEATVLSAAALLLLGFRSAFYRRRPQRLTVVSPGWFALLALTVAASIWLGFFSYRHVDYANELWWDFAWRGEAPRFLRASVGIVAALFAVGLASLIHRPAARAMALTPPQPQPDIIGRLVAKSGDAQTNIAWLGDKTFLVSEDGSAFLMYRRSGQSLVTMGDPVGDPRAFEEVVWQLREIADRLAVRTVFYAVRTANLPLYLDMGLAVLKIGEVARVSLAEFGLEGKANQEHRYAARRLEREGITFSIVPAAEFPAIEAELRRVSDHWLAHKKGQEKGFSLGAFKPEYLRHFDTAVLRKDGRIVAFANLWRTAGKQEISADLMRYEAGVSNALMDGLFVSLMLYGKAEGYRWFNLGAAPLAGLPDHPLASAWSRLGTYVYKHGDHFYHFEGLRAFKEKFDPVWTPQFIACPGGLAIPQVLLDINRLISGPAAALIAGGRAKPRQETAGSPIA